MELPDNNDPLKDISKKINELKKEERRNRLLKLVFASMVLCFLSVVGYLYFVTEHPKALIVKDISRGGPDILLPAISDISVKDELSTLSDTTVLDNTVIKQYNQSPSSTPDNHVDISSDSNKAEKVPEVIPEHVNNPQSSP